jgi:uncharacterized membrane-anchored protein
VTPGGSDIVPVTERWEPRVLIEGAGPRSALRVPEITAFFWIIKALSTAMGESTSDYLVNAISPVVAVLIGFVGFVAAILIQFRMRRYVTWAYWLAVVMVGVFGTMVADVVHVAFGVPYEVSASLFAALLALNFVIWRQVEGTLSIHSINSTRREIFYWLTVVATFALGTALGDLTAVDLHLGYLPSAVLFAVAISIPAIGFATRILNPVVAFWIAYVLTRPLGASVADWLGKPTQDGGLGVGSGIVALVFTIAIVGFVAFLSVTRSDVQRAQPVTRSHA